jgi:malate/lactate dehydrogenase
MGRKRLHLGIVGLGRIGKETIEEIFKYASLLEDFDPHLSIVSTQEGIEEIVKEKNKYRGKKLLVDYPTIDNLDDCDFIIYNRAWENTPYWFEEFDNRRLGILVDKYIEFLKDCKNNFDKEQTKKLDMNDYKLLVEWAEPILSPSVDFSILLAKKTVSEADFVELKNNILKNWMEKWLNGNLENSNFLPEEVFDPFCKKQKHVKGIPDVVFEAYSNQCLEEGLEFLGSSNLKNKFCNGHRIEPDDLEKNESLKKSYEQCEKAFDIYKIMRGIRHMGYRAMRFLPYEIDHIQEDAKKLSKYKNSQIFIVTNPTDYVCEIMYRNMGKEAEKRILGANGCDSSRHITILWNLLPDEIMREAEEAGIEIVAHTCGTHDSNARVSREYELPKALKTLRELIDKLLHNSTEQTEKINREVITYPARHGIESYFEVVSDLLENIQAYLKGKKRANSTRVLLSDLKGFSDKELVKKNIDKGGFLGLPVTLVNKRDEDNPLYEIQLEFQSENDEFNEGIARGYNAEIELMRKLEEKGYIPPVPSMPCAFDLGYLYCKYEDSVGQFSLDSSSTAKRTPKKKIAVPEGCEDWAFNGRFFAYKTDRKRGSTLYASNKAGQFEEIAQMQEFIEGISCVDNQVFIKYHSYRNGDTTAMITPENTVKDIGKMNGIFAGCNDCLIGKVDNGLVCVDKQGSIKQYSLNKLVEVESIRCFDDKKVVCFIDTDENLHFWDIEHDKKIQNCVKSKFFDICAEKGKATLYLAKGREIRALSFDSIDDLFNGMKSSKQTKTLDVEQDIKSIHVKYDKNGSTPYLIVLHSKQIEVLSTDLGLSGNISFEKQAELIGTRYLSDEV